MKDLYPWLEPAWRRITADGGPQHHGIVLTGVNGIGKREFALALAQKLLCANPAESACGGCQNCRLFAAGSHPDFHVLLSEQESESGRIGLLSDYAARYPEDRPGRERRSTVIKVEKIRQLTDRFYQSSHSGSGRVALLLPADRMNVNAANALLKLLEEPPPNSHFLLVTDQSGSLLPTIRSRCVVEALAGPSAESSLAWLEGRTDSAADLLQRAVAGGEGPLEVLAAAEQGDLTQQDANLQSVRALLAGKEDAIALAEGFSKQDPLKLLRWMQRLVCQLARWQLSGSPPPWSENGPDSTLSLSPEDLFELYDKIGNYSRLARDQLNLRLAIEEILLSLRGLA